MLDCRLAPDALIQERRPLLERLDALYEFWVPFDEGRIFTSTNSRINGRAAIEKNEAQGISGELIGAKFAATVKRSAVRVVVP